MPIVADASAAVRADLSPFKRDLSGLDKPVQSLGARIKSALSPKNIAATAAGSLAGVFVASKAVDFLGDAISAASDLNETVTKTGQIFGQEALPALEAWASTASDTFGESKQQALDAASTFAIFGKSAGLAGNDLVGFSTNLTELSADFASFFNTSPEDAITAISAALRGEQEPIRKYGVLLDEATLRQRALQMGIVNTTTKALTPQQRVLAAQAEIFAQTSDAQGDFARTSDGLANTQRSLQAQWADMQAEIGDELLPIMLKLVSFVKDELIPVIGDLVQIGKDIGGVIDGVADAGSQLDNVFVKAHDTILDQLHIDIDPKEWAFAVHDFFADSAHEAGVVIDNIGQDLKSLGVDAGGGLQGSLRAQKPQVKAAATDVAEQVPTAFQQSLNEAKAIAKSLPGDIADAILAGKKDLQPIRKLMKDIIAGSVSDAASLAQNAALLLNPMIADALTGNSKEAQDAMLNEVVEPLIDSILTLEPAALEAGADIPKSLKEAINQNGPLAVQALRDLMGDSNATLAQLKVFAKARGLEGIAALIQGMIDKKRGVIDTARGIAYEAGAALDFSPAARSAGQAVINAYMDAMETTIGRRVTGFENKVDDLLRIISGTNSPPYTAFINAGTGAASHYMDALTGGIEGLRLPSLLPGMPGFPVASASESLGGGGNTFNVTTGSTPKEKSTLDIAYELRRAEYLGILGSKQ